jgi:hypothetical protein
MADTRRAVARIAGVAPGPLNHQPQVPAFFGAALATKPGLSGKTVNNYVSVVREALALAVKDGALPSNPAERDALAAQVARAESLAGQWERLAATAINPDSREWLQACSATLRECLSGWQKMHDALAGSEADTSDTQPTDQEVSDE